VLDLLDDGPASRPLLPRLRPTPRADANLISSILGRLSNALLLAISGHKETVRGQEVADAGGYNLLQKNEAQKSLGAAQMGRDGTSVS
jgi:hypothetical protein